MDKASIGDVVHIEFWDHAQDSSDALLFEIFGRVTKITKAAYIVHYWRYVDAIQRASDDNRRDNEDCYAIVKKAIQSLVVLS